ncbi:hypothetical protein KI387_018182, partial [Taxus chinensis]
VCFDVVGHDFVDIFSDIISEDCPRCVAWRLLIGHEGLVIAAYYNVRQSLALIIVALRMISNSMDFGLQGISNSMDFGLQGVQEDLFLGIFGAVISHLVGFTNADWAGPWRWFDESMLDCCEPLEKVKIDGISFGKVACLANCSGAKVDAFRSNESSLDEFRRFVAKCASSEDCHVITSYHRGLFKQTGSGHFSPIGGYHAGRDMALILDVARFKYPPHWVSLSLLWEAMNTIDESTQQHRGFMLISKREHSPSLLYTL